MSPPRLRLLQLNEYAEVLSKKWEESDNKPGIVAVGAGGLLALYVANAVVSTVGEWWHGGVQTPGNVHAHACGSIDGLLRRDDRAPPASRPARCCQQGDPSPPPLHAQTASLCSTRSLSSPAWR